MKRLRFWAQTLCCLIATGGCTQKSTSIAHTFRFAWENAPRTVDPRYTVDADSQYLGDFIHCSLVSYDAKGNLRNSLASALNWIDSKTLDVTLKNSFHFSNQQPVTVSDVQANFEFYTKKHTDISLSQATFLGLKSVEILGADRLRFHLSEPNGEFETLLSVGLLPKQQALGPRISDPKKVLGCGNFTIEQWTVSQLLLKRIDGQVQKDVQFIQIQFIKDENTRFLKLRNAELDLVQNSINRDQLMRIQEYEQLRLVRAPGLTTTYLAFQYRDPILKNKKVRQAISAAIDRSKLIEHILHGWAIPAATILTPADPYFNQDIHVQKYSPEKSKHLLDEAGFPMTGKNLLGPRFTLQLKTTTNPTRLMMAHAIADELRQVGIVLQIESMDWGKFKSDVDRGNAQMWSLMWVGFKGPDIFRFAFATNSVPPNGANRGRVSNPKLDALVLKARHEIDFKKRKMLYSKVQDIVDDEMPYVFLWHEDQYAVLHKRVKNYELFADGRLLSIEDVELSN